MSEVKVDLASGEALVDAGSEVTVDELLTAVEGKVIFSWVREALARLRWRRR